MPSRTKLLCCLVMRVVCVAHKNMHIDMPKLEMQLTMNWYDMTWYYSCFHRKSKWITYEASTHKQNQWRKGRRRSLNKGLLNVNPLLPIYSTSSDWHIDTRSNYCIVLHMIWLWLIQFCKVGGSTFKCNISCLKISLSPRLTKKLSISINKSI